MKPHEYRVLLMASWLIHGIPLLLVLLAATFKQGDPIDALLVTLPPWQVIQICFSIELDSQPETLRKRWGPFQFTRHRGIVALALFPRLWSKTRAS